MQECTSFWSNISETIKKSTAGMTSFKKTQLDGWNSLSNVPIFILSQHFHQINQQQRTVVLHIIANILGLTDSFKEVD